MSKHVAFLGLGIMGGAMARNLAKAGHCVVGWNRSADRPGLSELSKSGVTLVPNVPAAVKDADFIITCVSDVPDVEEVLFGQNGVSGCARPGSTVIDTSTIGLRAAQHFATRLAEHNLKFLDAPVTGGDVGARQGTLTILVGGSRADFDQAAPLFNSIGKSIHYCGPAGSGQAVKLCNQILCAVNMVALSESLALAKQLGIEPSLILECLAGGAGGSWALTNLGPRMTKSDFEPGFMIRDMLKDLRLIDENLTTNELLLPGVKLAQLQFLKAATTFPDGGERKGTQSMLRAYSDAPIK